MPPDARGGALLDALGEAVSAAAGERAVARLLRAVAASAAQPYLDELHTWLFDGRVDDAHSEFMVLERAPAAGELAADYDGTARWRRFALRSDVPPPAFLAPHAARVLETGRFLNALRECGELARCPHAAERLTYREHEAYYARVVARAHEHAARLLLQTLRRRAALHDRLHAASHFFLLRRGDAISRFLALASDELAKRVGSASRARLATMLGVALRDAASDGAQAGKCCRLRNRSIHSLTLRRSAL